MLRPACIFGLSLFVASCLPVALFAQVFEVGGGTSSLYQASGGSLTVHAESYDFKLGAGIVDGHLLEGVQMIKATAHAKYVFGDDRIGFELPTDIFDTSHFLLARGAGVRAHRGQTDILAFAGATAMDYNSPLFNGAKTDSPAGVLFLNRRFNTRWRLFSDTVFSKKMTSIEALQWRPRPGLDLAVAAGLGASQPYGAASLKFSRHWMDGQAAYIAAGKQFHRVAMVSPWLAEPDRENVLVTVRPTTFLTFSGAHQNYLVPQYPIADNVRSSVDQGSAGLRIFRTLLNGTVYHSSYRDESNHAVSFSAVRDFTQRLHVMANYLASRPKGSTASSSFISTLSEELTPRLSVNQTITTSGGHTGIAFGGQFLSNFATVSANYDTYYVPANNAAPFQQSLVLDVKMNLFGRLNLHGSSFIDPTGHIRHTVDANTVASRGGPAGPVAEHISIGEAILRGCVVDTNGAAIEGAALLIDRKLVYTDENGCFFLREHRPHTHTLAVVPAEFLAGSNWQVVSAPSTIASHPEKDSAETPAIVIIRHAGAAGSLSVATAGTPVIHANSARADMLTK